jgi:hypothetical protein
MLLAIFFAVDSPNSVCVADVIFRKLGLKAWSNDTRNLGTHYGGIYPLILAVLCYLGVVYNLKTIYPKFIKKLPWVLLIIFITYPTIFINTTKVVKSFSKGLDAVYYYSDDSIYGFYTEDDKYLKIQGNLMLQNCGDEDIQFGIKIIPPKHLIEKGIFENKPIKNIRYYTLYPREKRNILLVIDKIERKNLSYFQGDLKDSDIILFNKQEEKKFKKY